MRDVAERAGVSVTTVSHVVNKSRTVHPDTRLRVENAVQALGYQPNFLARSLRRGISHTVGIILPDNANPYFAEVVRGIEESMFAQGYSVILCNSDNDLEKEHHHTSVLIEKQVDGIIFVAAGLSTENITNLKARGIPLVLVDRYVPGVDADIIVADNHRGGWLATQHLLDLDHRVIACISGPESIEVSSDRVGGYRQAIEDAGIKFDPALVVAGDFQFQSGYLAAKVLFEHRAPPTAIFTCNDLMAIGTYRFANENGIKVPEALSIVGFDDTRLAVYSNPPLTTIRQPKQLMGVRAAQLLLERLNDGELQTRKEKMGVELVIRRSTAPHIQPPGEIIT